MTDNYDLLVIGAGVAGVAAAKMTSSSVPAFLAVVPPN